MIIRQTRLSFTAGELSPWASARVDLDMFPRGAARIHNFTITPFGGLTRRPGFVYVDEVPSATGGIRLVPFQYSTGDAFILELTPYVMRFYTKGKLLRKGDGSPYTVSTPWPDPDVLHLRQINDVVYVCSGNYNPWKLSRYGNLDWRLQPLFWKNGPWRNNMIQPLAADFYLAEVLGSGQEIYSIFLPGITKKGPYGGTDYLRITVMEPDQNQWIKGNDWAGYWYTVGKKANLASVSYNPGDVLFVDDGSGFISWFECINPYLHAPNFNGSTDPRDYTYFFAIGVPVGYAPMKVDNLWEFRTSGTWYGEWILQKSYDNGTSWTTVKSFYSANDSNFVTNGDESDAPCLMRVRLSQVGTSQQMRTVNFRAVSRRVHHLFELLSITSDGRWRAAKLDGDAIQSPGVTHDWSLSSFGSFYGYPRTLSWHQNRMVYASTPGQPQTLWISATDDYENFLLGSDDSDAVELTLSANSQNRIQWLHSQQRLFLGTAEGEWTLDTVDGKALTPSNARFICHSHQGSEAFSPIPMESSLVFLQKGGKKLRELSYHLDSDGYLSTDLTLFAGHISMPGIRDACLYEDGTQILWAVKSDGEAVSMTWIPGQNILAWNRQILAEGARFLSFASIRGESQSQQLWAVVERSGERGVSRSVERLGEDIVLPSEDEEVTFGQMPVYLDSHKICPCRKGKITGIQHLRGLRVTAYPKDDITACLKDLEVGSGGEIQLPESEMNRDRDWVVGVPYVSLVTTSPFDQLETQGQLKSHVSTKVKLLHSSMDLEYSSSLEGPWFITDAPQKSWAGTVYYSGYVSLNQPVFHQEAPQLSLRTGSVYPLNILTIVPRLAFEQDQ